jgi:hypothetical protein
VRENDARLLIARSRSPALLDEAECLLIGWAFEAGVFKEFKSFVLAECLFRLDDFDLDVIDRVWLEWEVGLRDALVYAEALLDQLPNNLVGRRRAAELHSVNVSGVEFRPPELMSDSRQQSIVGVETYFVFHDVRHGGFPFCCSTVWIFGSAGYSFQTVILHGLEAITTP